MKNTLILTIVLFSIKALGQVWTPKNDFAEGGRYGASYFSLDGDAYLLGGLKQIGGTYTGYDDFWKYDHVNDSWDILESYPGGDLHDAFTFVLNQTVYIGLGVDQFGNFNNEVWSYNAINGWQQVANFPGSLRFRPFSFSAAGNGYVGAGLGAGLLLYTDMWEYNPITDVWTQKSNYPGSGIVGQVTFSIHNKGYVGMGDDEGCCFYNDFFMYNPLTDIWSIKSNFTGQNRSFTGTVVVDGKGYMLGGESISGGFTSDMWEYDPINDVWLASHHFSGIARRYGALYFLDNKFYYGLGAGHTPAQLQSDFWAFNLGVTGISKLATEDNLLIYPNPFLNQFTIRLNASLLEEFIEITVYNSLMQTVYNGNDLKIDTKKWKPGLYYVQVETVNGVSIHSIVK